MDEVNSVFRSIRVGTVDFFGILIPGLLAVVVYAVGFFIPLFLLVLNATGGDMTVIPDDPTLLSFIVFVLLAFSYVLGYIIRLSSPDVLDRISARNVIIQEMERRSEQMWIDEMTRKHLPKDETGEKAVGKKGPEEVKQQPKKGKGLENEVRVANRIIAQNAAVRKLVRLFSPKKIVSEKETFANFIEKDGWPYNPDEPMDKYPYFHFCAYLERRGHEHLKDLIIWGSKSEDLKARRSKSVINRMKMNVRINCPELSGHLESKEGHIRLMAGAWAAFRLSIWPVTVVTVITTALAIMYKDLYRCLIYTFVNINLLAVMLYSKNQIEKLFHYRRVSELFHIVQAAYIAQQRSQK